MKAGESKFDSKEIARLLLDKDIVKLNFKEPFQFVSGILSPIYEDERQLISFPEDRKVIVDAMESIAKNSDADYIGGVSTAGIPWASWLSDRLGKPMLYVRPRPREYGTAKQIEGSLDKGKKVLVIEAMVSTGGSLLSVVDAIERAGGIVEDVIIIYTHEFEGVMDKLERKGLNVYNLTEFSTVVEAAHDMNKISKKEKEQIFAWNDDPQQWADKFKKSNML